MADNWLITTAATTRSRYVSCLRRQRLMHGDRIFCQEVPDRGSWEANTKIKPDAIREAFKLADVVLWVDADCTVHPTAALPDGDWDICVMDNIHPKHKCRVSAGFILFRNTPATMAFLARWDENNQRHSKDHPAMMQTLGEMCHKMKIGDMTEWLRGRHAINALAPSRGVVRG